MASGHQSRPDSTRAESSTPTEAPVRRSRSSTVVSTAIERAFRCVETAAGATSNSIGGVGAPRLVSTRQRLNASMALSGRPAASRSVATAAR